MPSTQEQYDDAMFDFSRAEYDAAISKLRALLEEQPEHFDARLAVGMALYRRGDYAAAIAEGHIAEQLQPKEQLVHTNLSLFYMKAGDKQKAEHHGLQARLAGWRENMTPPVPGAPADSELRIAVPRPPQTPPKLPEMPWKKKPPLAASPSQTHESAPSISGQLSTSRERVNEFVPVAEVASLPPGRGRTVHVKDREFALWNLDGNFYCLDDACPHRGGPLGAGCLQDGLIYCPLHGWGFDPRTGACENRPDKPVQTYPTRVVDGQVQICV